MDWLLIKSRLELADNRKVLKGNSLDLAYHDLPDDYQHPFSLLAGRSVRLNE